VWGLGPVEEVLEEDVPQGLMKEVGEAVKWLLCGGVQGLEELASRSLEQAPGLVGESLL
jgi:hypothetical protein